MGFILISILVTVFVFSLMYRIIKDVSVSLAIILIPTLAFGVTMLLIFSASIDENEKYKTAHEIVKENTEIVRTCDVALANLNIADDSDTYVRILSNKTRASDKIIAARQKMALILKSKARHKASFWWGAFIVIPDNSVFTNQ